jgi:membrane protein YdbS with pleckstrin-like domain
MPIIMQEALNNFPEFLLFGSVFLFYTAVILFTMVLFISEITENGWTALWAFGIFMIVISIWSNFEPLAINNQLYRYRFCTFTH